MKRLMVRYAVKRELVAENGRLIADVFEQLHQTRPQGLRHTSFKQDDGVRFTYIVSLALDSDHNPLPDLPAYKTFIANIKECCSEPSVSLTLTEIGNDRFIHD